MRQIAFRGRSAVIVAIIPLVVAASGTAMAASKLVSGDRLVAGHSLSGNQLRDRTVTGEQIRLNSLGTVPSAQNASHASTADTATSATSANAGKANMLGGQWRALLTPRRTGPAAD
jgi:hypothetical protein